VVAVDRHRPSNLERRQSHLASVVAARPGWHLVAGYADVGSGRLDRPGLGRLLADAAAGWFEIVVVDDLDRLCRDPNQRAWIEKRLATAGVRVLPLAASPRRRGAAVLTSLVISDYLNS
jgi:DNA invertase Pin-like site-specific DNA recombinase